MDDTIYTLRKGQFLTLDCSALDADGNPLDISTGYTFVLSIKKNLSDEDANALDHETSVTAPTRFVVQPDNTTVRVFLLISTKSNTAEGRYYYDAWAVETASGQETPMAAGRLNIDDTATDVKT